MLPLLPVFLEILVPPDHSPSYLVVKISLTSPNSAIHTQHLSDASTSKSTGGPRKGERKRYVIDPLHIVDDRRDPQLSLNRPLQGEFNFGDSSGPFLSIYSKAADDEDNRMVDRWQKEADGVLYFVSPRSIHIYLC